MARAFLLVLDSFGVGGAPDAEHYGDLGANTLGHIAEFCAAGAADRTGLRSGPLKLPNMCSLGLLEIARQASGDIPAGMEAPERILACMAAPAKFRRARTLRPVTGRSRERR